MGRKRRTFIKVWRKIDGLDYSLAMEPNFFYSKTVALGTAEKLRQLMGWSVRIVPFHGGFAIYQNTRTKKSRK